MHYKQSGGSERSREQHQPQQQFGAQSEVVVAFKESFQNLAYPCEMNRLPLIMRDRKKAFQDSSRAKTSELIRLEFACQGR
jgi:hypothetical protein